MKRIILSALLAIIAFTTNAQSRFSLEAKAGIGTANFYGKDTNTDTRIAYKAGVGFNYQINSRWTLKPSLSFVSIGARKDIQYVGSFNMNEMYLQLPVMMAFNIKLGNNYTAQLSAGPYISYGIGGMTSGSIDEYSVGGNGSNRYREFRIYTFGNLSHKSMGNKRLDAGLMLGINLEYNRLIFGAELQVGITNVNNQLDGLLQEASNEAFHPHNLASFFTLGYRFWRN